MNSRILLIGRNQHKLNEIKTKILQNKHYTVRIVSSIDTAITALSDKEYHLIGFYMDRFNNEKLDTALSLRKAGFPLPVVVFSGFASRETLIRVNSIPRTSLIEIPFHDKELYGVLHKLVSGSNLAQKIHRRFLTNQITTLQPLGSGQILTGRMTNLSRGGAQLEFELDHLRVGNMICLNVQLGDVSKNYYVHARIVWKNQNKETGTHDMGIKFIQSKKVNGTPLSV